MRLRTSNEAPGIATPRADLVGSVAAGARTLALDYPLRLRSRPPFEAVERLMAEQAARYEAAVGDIRACSERLVEIPLEATDDDPGPRWLNGWVPGLDAAALYAFVSTRRPKRYIEVGSGNSTKFVRRAIDDAATGTTIVSIDPHPRAEVDVICDVVVRSPLEDADLSVFDSLSAGDVVFVDNSHRCLQNSDATVVFCEVLPRLPRGVLFGVHDIFLPDDYPPSWTDRLYSEQYALAAWLLGGANGATMVLPAWYVVTRTALGQRLDELWDRLPGVERHGNALWIET
jgi:hypothetical protein